MRGLNVPTKAQCSFQLPLALGVRQNTLRAGNAPSMETPILDSTPSHNDGCHSLVTKEYRRIQNKFWFPRVYHQNTTPLHTLAGWLSWLECRLLQQKIVGSILSQGTCLGCGFNPWLRHIWEVTKGCFSLISVFLSLSLSSFLSKRINMSLVRIKKKKTSPPSRGNLGRENKWIIIKSVLESDSYPAAGIAVSVNGESVTWGNSRPCPQPRGFSASTLVTSGSLTAYCEGLPYAQQDVQHYPWPLPTRC